MSVYYFSSPTCAPCNAIKPVVADLKEEFDSLKWHSVNIQNDPENLCERFGVRVVPTIVCVSASGTVEKHSGTNAAGYYRILRNASR
jgi:thioredoxin-like negative regulator of GroEL